jgi:hydrogenase nickel incorporation protein HypA/HybF
LHELTITENILRITLDHANKEQATLVTDLYLVIGQLSSIIDESVQFYWSFIAKGTIAENARLHFQRISTVFFCNSCELEYFPKNDSFTCPFCGGKNINIKSGEEFMLESISIEK